MSLGEGAGAPSPAVLSGGFRFCLHRHLPSGVVDGIVFGIDQLAYRHHGVAVLAHKLQDGGQGLRCVERGIVEQNDAPRLQVLCDPLVYSLGVVILPVQAVPIGKDLKPLRRKRLLGWR